jgi:putative flippase GtrA
MRDVTARLLARRSAVRLRRFATVGTVAAAVQTALLWAFVEHLGLHYLVAAVIAIEITIVLQYVLNNSWTFRPSRHRTLRSYAAGLVRTNLVRGTAIPIQAAILFALVAWGDVVYVVANLVAIAISGVYRYYLDSRWTWEVPLGE